MTDAAETPLLTPSSANASRATEALARIDEALAALRLQREAALRRQQEEARNAQTLGAELRNFRSLSMKTEEPIAQSPADAPPASALRTPARPGQPGADDQARPGPSPNSPHGTGPHPPFEPAPEQSNPRRSDNP